MKRMALMVLLLFGLAASFLAGSWYSEREAPGTKPSPVGPPQAGEGPENDPFSVVPGTVKITPEKQQVIGVRVGRIDKKPVSHTLRILGRVAADETRICRIFAAADGWILKTFNNPTGSLVKKDEVLASFYTPELINSQRQYIYWLNGLDRQKSTGRFDPPDQIGLTAKLQYIDSLQKLGMENLQIEEITRTRQFAQEIQIRTPISGFVIARNVSVNQRLEKGNELFRIADLSRVWILADLFENESEYLQPGKSVKISLPNQGKTFQAKVSDVLPQFDPSTRTLKVRLETDNPGYALKPDMFVDVELPINLPPVVTAPADAVLDSGLRKMVFVERSTGFFEPREIETGRRIGNRVEIVKGLSPGEKIVLSGNFLIDSESRFELAAAGMVGTLVKDPVCGMDVAIGKAEKAGRRSTYKEVTYYFCSGECRGQFDKSPQQYTQNQSGR